MKLGASLPGPGEQEVPVVRDCHRKTAEMSPHNCVPLVSKTNSGSILAFSVCVLVVRSLSNLTHQWDIEVR